MPVKGWLTGMLSPELIVRGYQLTEDEDFAYLWTPGEQTPKAFSSHGLTIERVEAYIKTGGEQVKIVN